MVGFEEGYKGLIDNRVRALELPVLDDVARRGGTWLGTARSKVFPTPDGQRRARETIAKQQLKGLLVIGGNGSLTGAQTLLDVETGPGRKLIVGGVPASIDNDLACTSMAIGVDTALNTIVEAVDRIFDTASAHKRTFFIEVMGRDCGYLAMTSAIAAGADAVLVREQGKTEAEIIEHVCQLIERAYREDSTKRRVLVIKAENVAADLKKLKETVEARLLAAQPDVDTRITVLGHVVRGGSPTAFDRLLGARLAHAALRGMAAGQTGFMAGWVGPDVAGAACAYDPYVVLTPLETVLAETAKLMQGDTPLARWRKRVFQEVEPILAR
jgi:6-phosphofructokinase 1